MPVRHVLDQATRRTTMRPKVRIKVAVLRKIVRNIHHCPCTFLNLLTIAKEVELPRRNKGREHLHLRIHLKNKIEKKSWKCFEGKPVSQKFIKIKVFAPSPSYQLQRTTHHPWRYGLNSRCHRDNSGKKFRPLVLQNHLREMSNWES